METNFAGRSLGKSISYLARSIRWIVDFELECAGVGSGTYQFIKAVHAAPGINQNELSDITRVDKATVAKGIARLEAAGYLTRLPDHQDRRVRRLYLTDAGERVMPEVFAALRLVTDICTAGLTPEETATLFSLLDRVEAAVAAHIATARGVHK